MSQAHILGFPRIGSHRELMDADGSYATMFRLQAERFAESR